MGNSTKAVLCAAITASALASSITGCSTAPQSAADTSTWAVDVSPVAHPRGETAEWWYRSGAAHAARNGAMGAQAKNVIVFLGDGMSLSTVAAARILEGQRAGGAGEENLLSWERFPHSAFSKTYNTNSQTPDSAGTMTAIAAGVKSHMGAIGVSAGPRHDCADSQSRHVVSWLRLADAAGLASGVVTTARITHATPAATYAHVPDRNWETDAAMPQAARDAGCRDIAQQLLDFAPGRGPSVVLGGGRGYLTPSTVRDPEYPGKAGLRLDGRDLTAEWLQRNPGGAYVWNNAQLRLAKDATRLLGLFEFDHMQYEHDRRRDEAGEPDLAEMTRIAISRLAREGNGFVLLVEGGRIDHANHEGNAFRALDETAAMARAVQVAAEMTSEDDTLIVVTADHSHTLNIVGYPRRGNPILGKVRGTAGEGGDPDQYALDALGLPYTTLVYAGGAGNTGATNLQPAGPKRHPHVPSSYEPVQGRPDLSQVDTEHPDFMQEALLPMQAETHGGDDVGIWARGPGSQAFRSTMEQNVIYHVIVQATPALRTQLCDAGTCNAAGVPVDLPDPARFGPVTSVNGAAPQQ
ncbi:alkaline phosphatase [Pseudoxanthomonas daejeonensis]|uniref:alkaline phosphatase n=1 Tax=Pseudoxanthomonas daejeonensis TaxID=266062 RepID=UPI001F5410FB|nr:alkaline phosphatase [Pseudoxanthomonas daejeonensis]UNK58619.1 alkaline phosphatase [Pseudoxanthomonas daejeonensis]